MGVVVVVVVFCMIVNFFTVPSCFDAVGRVTGRASSL